MSGGYTKVQDADGVGKGKSQWNGAGTFEERVFTGWMQQRMVELVRELELPAGFALKNVSVEASSGDDATPDTRASVIFSRGKKKIGYEFGLKGDWEMGEGDDASKGTFKAPYVCDDVPDQDFEVEVKAKKGGKSDASKLLQGGLVTRWVAVMAAELREK
eukprot:TRINITY_DN48496_c0_g1_i1.p2 TRINITY_DN48496_c0_g1~~TRINITY_DN48496_c0_g1_i1.p2  ORF type:complete len:160 (+),score=69.75 TRINITY_DN48496_c0_g1_i1:109-588(+)